MTTPYYTDERVTLYHGDCLDVLAAMPNASVDAIVTDPPYGLEFMGKEWDAPWQESDVNADAGFNGGGISATKSLPSFTGSTNPKCQVCKGTRRGRRDGTAKVAVCLCADGGHFPNVRAVEMRAFQQWCEQWATECLRVLKPGGHLLAFGGSRTWHRLAVAVEDAGFEMRDSIAWLYGSGFPKSLNVATAIDRHRLGGPTVVRGPEDFSRELLPDEARFCAWMRESSGLTEVDARRLLGSARFITGEVQVVNTATKDAPRWGRRAMVPTAAAWEKLRPALAIEPPEWVEALVKSPPEPEGAVPGDVWTPGKGQGSAGSNEWQGWGTALKPAFEPIVVARKPLAGTVAQNVLTYGTGSLNIDACRINASGQSPEPPTSQGDGRSSRGGNTTSQREATRTGDASADRRYTERGGTNFAPLPGVRGGDPAGRWPANVVLDGPMAAALDEQSGVSKSVVRKPTGKDTRGVANGTDGRNMVMRVEDTTERGVSDSGGASRFFYTAKATSAERPKVNGIAHATVKPLDLMRWLVRLVTPPGGIVLDPFAGSGTTLEAAIVEGFRSIGIERETDYLPLIEQRIARACPPLDFTEATA